MTKYHFAFSNIIDNLHTIYLGIVKKLIELYQTNKVFGTENALSRIDNQMSFNHGSADVPNLQSIYMLANWKGKDFKSFLLHYGLPMLDTYCINDLVTKNFINLLDSIYILSEKRISGQNLDIAKSKMNAFLIGFTEIFGEDKITPNFHEFSHICDVIRFSGPLWLNSTFYFEGLNFTIRNFVRSSLRPELQIIDRINLQKSLDEDIEEIHQWNPNIPSEMHPRKAKSDLDTIKPLGKKISGTNKYHRCKIGKHIFSTENYGSKFKKSDQFISFNGQFLKLIDIIESDIDLKLVCKCLETTKLSVNTSKVVSESVLITIDASLIIEKCVPAKFGENLYLSNLSYDSLFN